MREAKASAAAKVGFYGADVASEHLDVSRHGSGGVRRVPNTDSGINALLREMAVGSVIAMESTGRYHEALARAAHRRGLVVYVLNPRAVRKYADGVGMRGKTDQLDAQLLARMIEREHAQLHPWQPPSPDEAALQELLRHRAALVKHKTSVRQAGSHSAVLQAIDAGVLQAFDAALKHVDQQIKHAVGKLPQGLPAFSRITSVPGLGQLCGSALLLVFQRLAARGGDAVIAFTGLDPMPADSGKKTGMRRLSKQGPAELRRLLYNAAMSAARTATWRGFYEAQRAKGLPSTAALIVLARKLVRVAFSLFKSQSTFDPAKARSPIAA
jgi:transposase